STRWNSIHIRLGTARGAATRTRGLCLRVRLKRPIDTMERHSHTPRHRSRRRHQDARALPARPSETTDRHDGTPFTYALGEEARDRLVPGDATRDLLAGTAPFLRVVDVCPQPRACFGERRRARLAHE